MHKVYQRQRPRLDRDAILAAVDWLTFWQSELPSMPTPKRSHGWTCGGCNPLRADATPGSFRVNLSTGGWHDFATGDGGDAIGWIRDRYGYDFPGALEVLEGFTR